MPPDSCQQCQIVSTDSYFVQDLIEFILSRPAGECGIIYCRLRSTCDKITSELSDADIDVASYHAGLTSQLTLQRALTLCLIAAQHFVIAKRSNAMEQLDYG